MKGHLALTSGWATPIAAGQPPEYAPRKPYKLIRPKKPRQQYVMKKPRARKIPAEIRAQLYQLELTRMETEAEILRIFAGYGFSKQGRVKQRARIIEERGL